MAEHYRVELGQAIKRRREELGLTQKQLAERTHHQEAQTVSRWERGENTPADIEIVAAALEWTIPELVAGIQPPDARSARRLGHVPQHQPTQLDRIEAKLDQLYQLFTGDQPDAPEEVLAGLADRVLSTTSSPPSKAAAPPAKSRAAKRRNVA